MISLVGTLVLVYGFSALLPPIPEDEESYYEIMELDTNASSEEVRKAYKKLSLKYHPDKVAQRGGNPAEAQAHYQKVQEANAVLSSPNKRRRYDALKKSPTRYRYVSSNLNPGSMYENLQQASFCDKSRLVFMALLLCCILLLQPILICAKINQDLRGEGVLSTTTWMAVLIPWWLAYGMIVVTLLAVSIISKQVLMIVAFVEHLCWFLGMMFLALRWDSTITWDYRKVFIPIYLALMLRWTHKVLRLRQIQNNLQRMVTLDYIETHVLEGGRTYQDLTEEEIHDIAKQYVVVHVPPTASSLEEEEEKVQASPEYEHAVDTYTETMNNLIGSILVSVPFLALVIAKVDGAISSSWWVVFVPIWISLGLQIVGNVYTCCCLPTVGEQVVGGVQEDDNGVEENVEKEADNDGFEDRQASPFFDSVEGSIKRDKSETVAATTDETNAASPDESKSEKAEASAKSETKSTALPESTAKSETTRQEETKTPDVVEEIPNITENEEEWSGIHIDDDMFHEFQSAYEEAEESAMEEQAKSQANCCIAVFQLMILCLLVGKLQQDYMRGENESAGYNAFWILFPIFLVFGCALCTCACLIYSAGESEGFDHLVERATHKEEHDEENGEARPEEETGGDKPDEVDAPKTEAVEETKEDAAEEAKVPDDSEMHDLD